MKSYKPEELSTKRPAEARNRGACAEGDHRRMSDNPHANGGLLMRDLNLPDFRDYAVEGKQPGRHTRPNRPA